MNLPLSGKVKLRAILYYVATTLLAVILGVILVVTIKPGDSVSGTHPVDPVEHEKKNVTTEDTLMDLVRNCFPDNIIRATMQQYKTHLIYPEVDNVRYIISLKHPFPSIFYLISICCRRQTKIPVRSSGKTTRRPGTSSHSGRSTPPTS